MTTQERQQPGAGASRLFSPLKQALYRVIWFATIIGNAGFFMRDLVSSWLITDLSSNPADVAMIQAAASLPVFLLAMPAGVLADIMDRRRLLIFVQMALALVSTMLMLLEITGKMNLPYLVALTFAGGIAVAVMGPAWQAILPEIVPLTDLQNAGALNSLAVNIARSIGPLAAGMLLASYGAGLTYGFNVLTFMGVLAALLFWRRPRADGRDNPEQFFSAFRAGVRYLGASRELRIVLFRTSIFFVLASALWALLPLLTRHTLGGAADFYGVLLGAAGVGAMAGTLILPWIRAQWDADRQVLLASLISAVAMAWLAVVPTQPVAVLMMSLLGVGWTIAMSTLNGIAQRVLPGWVRGRGIALYLTASSGAMAAGSLGWGFLARQIGMNAALLTAAVGLALSSLALYRVKFPGRNQDLRPAAGWADPMPVESIAADRGPVLVQIEYRVEASNRSGFIAAMKLHSLERLRDGAYAWGVSEDIKNPARIVEWFLVESWGEHLRQHQRVTKDDFDLQRDTLRFHSGLEAPVADHLVGLDLDSR